MNADSEDLKEQIESTGLRKASRIFCLNFRSDLVGFDRIWSQHGAADARGAVVCKPIPISLFIPLFPLGSFPGMFISWVSNRELGEVLFEAWSLRLPWAVLLQPFRLLNSRGARRCIQ